MRWHRGQKAPTKSTLHIETVIDPQDRGSCLPLLRRSRKGNATPSSADDSTRISCQCSSIKSQRARLAHHVKYICTMGPLK